MSIYNIKKNIDKVLRGESTYFIEMKDYNKIVSGLKKTKYNIYKPFNDSTKVIFYKNNMPKVLLYEIISPSQLRHQDILGSLYSLNISGEMFGDVVVDNGRYYIYILGLVDNYIKSNLTNIKNVSVTLEERNIDYLKDYKQAFEEYEIIVSSLRIDTLVSRIINTNRNSVIDMIKNKNIIVNYEVINKASYLLKENDIFSIKKYGKYKFMGIKKETKKNNYVISYLKYV
jgi:RNA-binding protein YlmH